jgi:hypothetical protein
MEGFPKPHESGPPRQIEPKKEIGNAFRAAVLAATAVGASLNLPSDVNAAPATKQMSVERVGDFNVSVDAQKFLQWVERVNIGDGEHGRINKDRIDKKLTAWIHRASQGVAFDDNYKPESVVYVTPKMRLTFSKIL